VSIQISLDGTLLVDTPRGWDDATIRSKKDKVINGLFTEYTTDLEFWGDGFTFINDVLDADGYCNIIDILIESDDCEDGIFVTEFEGVIPLTQITELNVDEAIFKAKIVDLGYNARISNNKKISAIVDTGKSKNGIDITPVAFTDIDFYDPTSNFNVYSFVDRNCYRVFDCFKFIIAHITDGIVGFESDLFDVGGECENLVILTGFELRQGSGNGEAPDISFEDLFVEISKKKNLGFAIVPSGSAGFNVKVEKDDFFKSEVASKTYRNVRGIKMNFNLDKMYSNVALGSQIFELATSLSFPPVRLRGFREENYTVQGECNIENELNLVSEWIVDSNTIEDVLTNGEDKHDDEIFLVETDGTRALKFDLFNIVRASGTNTSVVVNTLTDAGAGFVVAGVLVGDKVANQTTGAVAQVTIVAATVLTLDTDIFTATPEDYNITAPPFIYNLGLSNFASIINWLGNIPNSIVKFFGTGDDNFLASITTNTQFLAFPATVNPIIYDDDSTAPNFDTNGNYDPVTGRYEIPADGLYSFKATFLMDFLGELGSDVITNGDFSVLTDWFGVTNAPPPFALSSIDWVISTGVGEAQLNTNRSVPTQVMWQNQILNANSKYVLTFEITDYDFGILEVITGTTGVQLRNGGGTVHGLFDSNTPNIVGIHQVNINIVGGQTAIGFRGTKDASGQVSFKISNVTLQAIPKFTVTTSITRSNSNLQQLSSFNLITPINLEFTLIQEPIVIELFTSAFSSFQDDIIRATITIVDEVGAGTEVNLLTNSSFESTLVEDGGGELVGVDTEDFVAFKYEFEKELTISEFRDIVNNPEEAIVFNRGEDPDEDIIGWREDITFDKYQGIGKFILVSKQKILPCN